MFRHTLGRHVFLKRGPQESLEVLGQKTRSVFTTDKIKVLPRFVVVRSVDFEVVCGGKKL